jgi:hypothetical protein
MMMDNKAHVRDAKDDEEMMCRGYRGHRSRTDMVRAD